MLQFLSIGKLDRFVRWFEEFAEEGGVEVVDFKRFEVGGREGARSGRESEDVAEGGYCRWTTRVS